MGTNYADKSVDSFPQYPKGEYAFFSYIETNFRSSNSMRYQLWSSQQSVLISFLVDSLGSMSDVQFRNCESALMEAEFRRVLKAMPLWKPASKDGASVNFRMHVPYGCVVDEFGMRYVPENSPSASTVSKVRKKNPFIKWTMITAAVAVPIFAILKFK